MLTREDNELMCRVGPGTPMGELLREYWIPALHSTDLPERDAAPQRIRLLTENLIAFRDTSGRVGIVANSCPHRGASMFFGRNEEDGLRCVYHGWKFDVEGTCVDMPNEPAESNFKHKIHLTAYTVNELNGIIWVYMGKRETPPALPEQGFALVDEKHRGALKYQRDCNFVQALEGDIDTAHLGFLHVTFAGRTSAADRVAQLLTFTRDKAPALRVVETPIGVMYGARRNYSETEYHWRVSQFLMPFYTSIPGFGGRQSAKIWVPLDDEHTMVWETNWSMGEELSPERQQGWEGRIPPSGFKPDTTEWLGRARFWADETNDFYIDRERQKNENFTGFEESNPIQDGGIQVTMGKIFDRTKEHLGTTDATIVQVRKKLVQSAKAYQEHGIVPPGVDEPAAYRLHGAEFTLEREGDWTEYSKDLVRKMS